MPTLSSIDGLSHFPAEFRGRLLGRKIQNTPIRV
jgi:hypothetical protein